MYIFDVFNELKPNFITIGIKRMKLKKNRQKAIVEALTESLRTFVNVSFKTLAQRLSTNHATAVMLFPITILTINQTL
jgi:hypothetical protein